MKVKSNICPSCSNVLDGATGVNTDCRPKKNDLTVCGFCSEILIFDKNLNLSKVSPEYLKKLIPAIKSSLEDAKFWVQLKNDLEKTFDSSVLVFRSKGKDKFKRIC